MTQTTQMKKPVGTTAKQEKNMPEKKFRAGAVSATVWKNTNQNEKGTVEYKSVSFERGYKDLSGQWKSTHSLRLNDLPKAQLVLQKAYEYIAMNTDERTAMHVQESVEEEIVY